MRLLSMLFRLLLAMSVVCSADTSPTSVDGPQLSQSAVPNGNVVQLRYATVPAPLNVIAVHYWFVVFDTRENAWSRWEVWQDAGVSPTSWGHIQKNLQAPDAGVGGGKCRISAEWRGEKATRIIEVLHRPLDYPYRNTYRAWPGPNSNTYPAWVLHKARVSADMDPRAIGKDYCGAIGGGASLTRSGLHLDSPVVGFTVGAEDGVEVHVLCLTFGVDLLRPAIKTPFGRLGFSRTRHARSAPAPESSEPSTGAK